MWNFSVPFAIMYIDAVWFVVFALLQLSIAGVVNRMTFENFTGGKPSVLNEQDLGPPDHLDAVKFERDGDLNAEFYHEIFLGEEKHHFNERSNKQEQLKKLEEIFHKADANGNDFIEESELHSWVMKMVNDHMRQATKESEQKFNFVVGENTETVSYVQFEKGFLESLRKGNSTQGGIFTQEYIEARIPVIKEGWKKADLNNDTVLSKKEFLFFQHPEMSESTLNMAVKDFMDERDYDANAKLDEKEFVFGFPVGDIVVDDYMDGDEIIRDKVLQFRKFIDADRDGFVSVDELRVYLDPFSSLNARNDAHDIIFFVDIDLDQKLSLAEVKQAAEYLTGTKLFDASSFFHNEL